MNRTARALNLGAIDYLQKPPRFAELKTIIARVPALMLTQDGPATSLNRI
jgi:DNA-binding response OmpR family regulator